MASTSTLRLLQNTFKRVQTNPVEGFCVELPDDANFCEWKIYLEGPKDTPYAGGIFQLLMAFPQDYPMSPPTLRFTSEFWHPNVYKDGKVCISILHAPGEDMMSGELPEERWLPTQTVETIILSLMSMLGDPNISSPANVDASVEMRKQPDKYGTRIKQLVEKANKQLPPGIKIPHPDTNPDERKAALEKQKLLSNDDFMMDDYDDDYDDNYGSDYDDYDYGSDFDGGDYEDEEYGSDNENASDEGSAEKEKKEKKPVSEKQSKEKKPKLEKEDKKEEKKEKEKEEKKKDKKKASSSKEKGKTSKKESADKDKRKTKKKSKSSKTPVTEEKKQKRVKKTKKKS